MRNIHNATKEAIEEIRTILKSYVDNEEATLLKNTLHEWAKVNYKPKNSLSEYLRFINRWIPSFEKVHPQSTNFPYYLQLFTTVSQHVYGDCAEECLDKAIEFEKGKPRFRYTTPAGDDKFKSVYEIYRDKEVVSAIVPFNVSYFHSHLGLDDQYFDIPLDKPFNDGEVIGVGAWK